MPKKDDIITKDGKLLKVRSVSKLDPNHYAASEYQEFDAQGNLIKSGGKNV